MDKCVQKTTVNCQGCQGGVLQLIFVAKYNCSKAEELASVRLAQGKSPDPTSQLGQWKKRGFIVQDEATLEYVKTEFYLSRFNV
jgi:hypothetical protein